MQAVEEAQLEETVQISWYPSAALTIQKLVCSCTHQGYNSRKRQSILAFAYKNYEYLVTRVAFALPLSTGDRHAPKQKVTLAPFLENLARDL